MAAIIIPDNGKTPLLDFLVKRTSFGGMLWKLRLYVNDYTPALNTVFASFTEPSWSGYSPFSFNRFDWQSAVIQDHQAIATYGTSPILFTQAVDSPTIVYGYWVTDESNHVLWCQRFDAPVMVNFQAPLPITPQMRLDTYPFF